MDFKLQTKNNSSNKASSKQRNNTKAVQSPISSVNSPQQTQDKQTIREIIRDENPVGEDKEQQAIIQSKTKSSTTPSTNGINNPSTKLQSTTNQGTPMSQSSRDFFESRMNHDFSHVRIHTNSQASNTADSINAKAFTLGRDIVFNKNEYAPNSDSGKRLLAHELTHVMQQEKTLLANSNSRNTSNKLALTQQQQAGVIQRQDGDHPSTAAPTPADAERIANEFREIPLNSRSTQEFRSAVEARAGSLGFLGADAVVFSLSGAAGYWIGGGGGYEILYSPRFGWATYAQVGVGVSTPGAGVAFEVGLIWDLGNPVEYRGSFIELTVTGGPGVAGYLPGMASGSGSVTPGDLDEFVTEGSMSRPRGIKVGGGYGTSGATVSLFYEYYFQLTGVAAVPDIAHQGFFTFYVPTLLSKDRNTGFIIQLNTTNPNTRQVHVQFLYQQAGRRQSIALNLSEGETLNPTLLEVTEHVALFDLTGSGTPDLRILVPDYVILRGRSGLNMEVTFRRTVLRQLRYPGRPMGTSRDGREYFMVPGSQYRPGGPMYIDGNGNIVSDRDL